MSLRPTIILPARSDGTMRVKSAGAPIAPFSADLHGGQVFDIILPGQMVRIYAHEFPKMREREKLAAARFAIEEKTAAPLNAQHIAIGRDDRLAVTDSEALDAIITRLETTGIEIADIYADFDWAAPVDDPIILDDRIIFTDAEGYTIDPDWAEGDLATIAPSHWRDISTHENKLSLRQGELAKRTALSLPFASLSKIAASLAFAGAGWLALQGADARATLAQAADLKAQTAVLYTQATGQDAPVNPALTVTRAVKAAPNNNAAFLPLLTGLNSALRETDNISVQTLSYNAEKSQLDLRLIYPRFESAGEMEKAAARTGGTFSPGGVREQNGVLIGDAIFEIGGPS